MNYLLGTFDSIKWLTGFEMVLCLLNLVVLVRYAVPITTHYRWLDFLPSLGVLIAIASVIYGDTTLLAAVIYALTVIVFFCTQKRIFKPIQGMAVPKHRVLRVIICACGVTPILLVLLVAGELRYNPASDLSKMSYSKAFVEMNKRLALEYPFSEWKKINWDDLMNKYEPIFLKAENDKDKELYYKTLREYLFSIRDGHIKITNEQLYEDNPVFKSEVGGGFGISTVQLDNGKVLVSLVLKDSSAERNGIRLGAEIVTWDGKKAKEAFENTFWSESQMATDEDKIYNQGRFMARAPIGQEIQVEYRNSGNSEINKATLTAYDDNYETLRKTKIKLKKEETPIEGKILSNGYGYVKIKYFLSSADIEKPEKALAEQLASFQEKHVKGLVIDLRDNPGGEDALAAAMAGHFVKEEKLYEYPSYYNRHTKKFEINHIETITIKPAKPYYKDNIAILINNRTASSGEGLPLALKGLPNVKIVGFTSTNGSFGISSRPIVMNMPEGYIVEFPDGRSLNKDKEIQGDADYTGQGGAAPDIKIPLNDENFRAKYIDGQDVELGNAIELLRRGSD